MIVKIRGGGLNFVEIEFFFHFFNDECDRSATLFLMWPNITQLEIMGHGGQPIRPKDLIQPSPPRLEPAVTAPSPSSGQR